MALTSDTKNRLRLALGSPGAGTELVDAVENPTFGEDITLGDAIDAAFGASQDVLLRWSTGDASNHTFVIALDDTSQSVHITDKAAVATDWNLSANTHPTVYLHSNTTPTTDYLLLGGHDGTTGHLEAVGGTLNLTGVGSVSINEAGADVDFRIEADSNTNLLNTDAGLYTGVGAVGIGSAAVNTATVTIDPPAMSAVATVDYAKLRLDNTAAVTVPAGTTALVASLHVAEPNITATGTVTNAATVYIEAAPTEGGTGNYALWADSGVTRLDGNIDLAADAVNIIVGTTTGTKIGTATSQKLGFFNATPVVQQTAVTAVAAISGGESPTEAEHNLAVAAINDIITKLENLGFLAAN